jgi:membrane associated rhomboid family serine protease
MARVEASKDPAASKSELFRELKSHGAILGGFVAFLWLVHLVNAVLFQGHLAALGVVPRSISGLLGILFAPFIHGSFAHLSSNTLPLLVLGWFVMLRRKRDFLYVSLLTALTSGLGTWLIGPSQSVHVGASGLIFGYLGYLIARGFLERRFWPIVGSLAVLFLYGGALFGVLPGELGISWQMHLFGLLGGIGAAKMLATPKPKEDEKPRVLTEAAQSPLRVPQSSVRSRVELSGAAKGEPLEVEDELEELKRRVGR